MDHSQFIALVADMREAQQGFFREKKAGNRNAANVYLRQSLDLEDKVDKEIVRFQSRQTELNFH